MARYLAAIAFLLCSVCMALAEKRVALVVGNGAYRNTPTLANPVNDADDMAEALRRVGFTVQVEHDLTKRDAEGALARFARLAENADAALFFYAGHGVQYRGTNYLMPVDARLEDEFSINYELIRVDDVLFSLERVKGVKLLVLDACRNNPLLEALVRPGATRDVAATRGLARMDAARGMLVAYSTQVNQVAVDGSGRNSPFTSALLHHIEEPGVEAAIMFRRVAADVDRATGGRQLPELWVSLRGEFFINTAESDLQAWSKVNPDDRAMLDDFIRRFPRSPIAIDARTRVAALERASAEAARAAAEQERLAREQATRDRLAREQAQRERLAQEQAAREQAERERLARQLIERERMEQRLAQERADKEKADRETADREKAEREKAEQEKAAREQAEREKAEHERQRLEATRKEPAAAGAAGPQVAMLPPAADPRLSGGALVRAIKQELTRVGCYTGAIDDQWENGAARSAVSNFVRQIKLAAAPSQPDLGFLQAIQRSAAPVCPPVCRHGFTLNRDGTCVRREKETARRPHKAAPHAPARAAPQAPVRAASTQEGGHVTCGRRGCQVVPKGCIAVRHGGGGGLGGRIFCN